MILTVSSFRVTELNSSVCYRQWGRENVRIIKKGKREEIFNKPMEIAFG
jgi:hypothetical protein